MEAFRGLYEAADSPFLALAYYIEKKKMPWRN